MTTQKNFYEIIINKGEMFSNVGEQIVKTSVAYGMINLALKKGIAKLIIDTDTTLFYHISI